MKRFTILLLALCIYTSISAQVQTKFWGLELSKHYASIKEAQDIISDRCECAFIENNSISAQNGSLGGYDWDFINFLFFKEHANQILYKAAFYSYHTLEEKAFSKYYSLLEPLVAKYGTPEHNAIDEGFVVIWYDEKTMNGCSLSRIKSESKGGEILYYVILEYYNREYLSKAFYQEKSEL